MRRTLVRSNSVTVTVMQEKILPASTGTEKALDGAAILVSVVPWIGGAISNVLSGMSQGRKFDRVDEVLRGISGDLAGFKSEASEEYVRTDEFEDLLEYTLRRVGEQRNEEKRSMYRAFLSGDIESPGRYTDYDKKLEIVRAIELLLSDDIEVIRALRREPEPDHGWTGSPIHTLAVRLPGFDNRRIDDSVDRLKSLRIISSGNLRLMMTGRAAADMRTWFEPFGLNLIRYIADE